MTQGMGLDEFLGHSSSDRGGRVLNWRKRNPPQIDTWMHTQGRIVALWRHGWPRLVDYERDGEKSLEVWGGSWNCWEEEAVLRRQHKRRDDGSRHTPPVICPMCLLLEYLREQVRTGGLSWTAPAFKFEGDDDSQTQILTVAGMYNGFGGELTRSEVQELRRAGIRRDEAWKQNTVAKCSYVFSIVDHNDIGKGVQTAIETTAMGDAVKRVIRDQMDSLGETEGHPLRSPYVIRWEYKPQEQEFDKKYRALAMPKLQLSPEVRELIYDAPLPDIASMIERGNIASLRSVMEKHALIDLPFDKLFEAAENTMGQTAPEQEPAPSAPKPAARRSPKSEPSQPDYPAGTVTLPCDACGATMAESDVTCWKCGAKYEVDPPAESPAKPPEAPMPPAKPTAASAKPKAKEQAPEAPATPKAPPAANCPVPETTPATWPGESEDKLPF